MSLSEPSTNPWQPALDEKAAPKSQAPSQAPSLRREGSGTEVWAEAPPNEQPPTAHDQAVLIDVEEPESPAWDEDSIPSPGLQELPADEIHEHHEILEDQHAWDGAQGKSQQGLEHLPPTPFVAHEDPTPQGEGWNLVDREPVAGIGDQQSGVIGADGSVLEVPTSEEYPPSLPPRRSEEVPPALPPRRSEENPPIQPPRPIAETINTDTSSIASPAAAAIKSQKKETYEIKKITWHDANAEHNPRVSPILVQNANGPCPLLALVNALTLSTPANVETALVETLRVREQISLGYLLDAVFDELTSGRRGGAAQELPDVSDLYQFLITLHTGMNVNPRFTPVAASKSKSDPRNSMTHVHPSQREEGIPGTFEDTREMQLYSTFSIPLIHGWLPDRDSPAFSALNRSAPSYEDAQNLFFREEELEDKLQREGLSFEEQSTLEDIATIKAFFNTAATQLTSFGLSTITNSMAPGSVAILFRNDHFSTLYRQPNTLQLLQLVTDQGYSGHEEVVWESLIDVNGENAEFFSGDFRLVGGAPASPSQPHSQEPSESNEGWIPVPTRNKNQHQSSLSIDSAQGSSQQGPHSPNIEQEDHDLALALQLQEEEEERHREDLARRKREAELSQQFLEQQGREGNIPVSNTRGGGGARGRRASNNSSGPSRGGGSQPQPRPAVPARRNNTNAPPTSRPVDPEAGIDVPPPSYEHAANQAAYVPPTNHPAHPNSSPMTGRNSQSFSSPAGRPQGARRPTVGDTDSTGRRRQGSSAYTQQQQQQQQQNVADEQRRDKDCIVM